MTTFDTYDLKTEINTILNKSGELMDTLNISPTQNKNILQSTSSSLINESDRITNNDFLNETFSNLIPRPHTLEEFVKKEALSENNLKSTFKFPNLDPDEEIWVMDIPGTIDPKQLQGQVLQLGDKSKFKVGDDRYCAINRGSKSSLTCVFGTNDDSRKFKTVNIKPTGTISIRRKLSGTSKKKLKYEKSQGVPYPKVKVRHPFFGIQEDQIIVKSEKE